MNSADIIRALLHGDRDPVEDADDITINDGLQSVELHHRSPDGESAVVLTYGEYAQYVATRTHPPTNSTSTTSTSGNPLRTQLPSNSVPVPIPSLTADTRGGFFDRWEITPFIPSPE